MTTVSNCALNFMLTEAINDLKSKDRTCKRDPNPGFNPYIPIGDPNGNSGGNPVQETQYDLYMENHCVGKYPVWPAYLEYTYSYIYSTDGAAPTVENGIDRSYFVWSKGTKWGTYGTGNSQASIYEISRDNDGVGIYDQTNCTYKIGKRSQFSHIVSTRNVSPGGPIDDEIQRKDFEERQRWQR